MKSVSASQPAEAVTAHAVFGAKSSYPAADLTAAGRKGVVVNSVYDFWTPGRHYQAYLGGLRILSESASVRK